MKTETHSLRIERVLDAPADLVFEAWTSAEHAKRWWYPRENGVDFVCTSFEMDFLEGGAYRYCIRSPKGVDTWAHGAFREIVEGRRLVFSFQWEWAPLHAPDSLITVTFEALGADRTRLVFRQEPFEDAAMRDGHAASRRAVATARSAARRACGNRHPCPRRPSRCCRAPIR